MGCVTCRSLAFLWLRPLPWPCRALSIHKNVSGLLASVDLHFIRCSNSRCHNKGSQALEDYLIPGVTLQHYYRRERLDKKTAPGLVDSAHPLWFLAAWAGLSRAKPKNIGIDRTGLDLSLSLPRFFFFGVVPAGPGRGFCPWPNLEKSIYIHIQTEL